MSDQRDLRRLRNFNGELARLKDEIEASIATALGIGTVYIDGAPTLWSEDSFLADSPMLTTSDMSATADPAWVTAVAGVTADNGTIDIAGFDHTLRSSVTPYWPVWVVPLMGRQCRVILDDIEATSVDGAVVQMGAGLQNGTFNFEASSAGGWTDDFQYVGQPGSPVGKRWLGYGTLYPAEVVADFQTPPLQSLTQQESASIYYGAYRIDPQLPYMTVTVSWDLVDPGDIGFTLTGLRVERS